jgi:plasmid stabilization system protein ParE
MSYRLSPLAERDLDEIWSYVAEDATPTTADRLVDDVINRFDLLAEQPGMGRARPEFGVGCDRSQSRTTSSTIVKKTTTF